MINDQVAKIQDALFARGYLVGATDGIWGRRTIAALRAFQEDAALEVDGIFGPRTARKLFPLNGDAPAQPLLPWIEEAKNLTGLREVPGAGSNPTLLEMARTLGIPYSGDDIAWCGLFVAHCIGTTLPDEVLPTHPLGARRWETFGELIQPRLGAVMVFWRESKASGLGHVGFYAGEDDGRYLIFGGNQGNKVDVTPYRKSEFITARWPRTATSLGGGEAIVPVEITQDGAARKSLTDLRDQSRPH